MSERPSQAEIDEASEGLTKVQITAPETIYLQVSDESEYRDEAFPKLYADGDVTWCADSVMNVEVKYTRADIAQAALAEKDRKIAELDAGIEAMCSREKRYFADTRKLTRQATELQSRLDKWEKWVPADGSLAALKEQAEDSSLAAKTAYINGLEFHLKHAERQNTEQVKLLAMMRDAISKDAYALMTDIANGIDSPATCSIATNCVIAFDKALSATPEIVEQYLEVCNG